MGVPVFASENIELTFAFNFGNDQSKKGNDQSKKGHDQSKKGMIKLRYLRKYRYHNKRKYTK